MNGYVTTSFSGVDGVEVRAHVFESMGDWFGTVMIMGHENGEYGMVEADFRTNPKETKAEAVKAVNAMLKALKKAELVK